MILSVVIPVYNVEAYLDECLGSVAAQSFQDWEGIIVDDGSTDGTAAIVDAWAGKDARFRVVHQENRGLSVARNVGMEQARGEFLLFLDGDDWIEENTLERIINSIDNEDVLCFNGRRFFQEEKRFEETDNISRKTYDYGWEYYTENALSTRKFAFVSVVLRAYRREFIEQNKLTFKEGYFHEDNLFTPIVCYYAKRVRVIDDCLYNYRVRGGSIMTSLSQKHQKDKVLIANKLAHFFADKDVSKTTVYRYITHMYQTVFYEPQQKEAEKELLSTVDWKGYYRVSRTKLRHRVLYAALRVNPTLFRCINNCLTR